MLTFPPAARRPCTAAFLFVAAAAQLALAAGTPTNPAQTAVAINSSLGGALKPTGKAMQQFTCTATQVFLDGTFMKFVFGLLMLVTLVGALVAWFSGKSGGSVSKIFMVIIYSSAFLSISGFLTQHFMGC